MLQEECRLNVSLIWISGSTFVQWSVTVCAILVESTMRNTSVKLFLIWVSGSAADVV